MIIKRPITIIIKIIFFPDSSLKNCVKCKMRLPEDFQFQKCESCRSMLPDKFMNFISPGQTRFPCIVCSRIFISKFSLEEHLRLNTCKRKPRFSCADCSFTSSQAQDFTSHMMKFHARKTLYKCQSCKKIFNSLYWLETHQKLHCLKQKIAFYCAHCSYRCYRKQKIEDHLRCTHVHIYTGKRLNCQMCGTKWSNIFKFNDHIGMCTGEFETELAKQKLRRIKP